MLTIKLSHVLNARGIDNHFTHLVKSGFTRHSAYNLLHSETRVIKLDHLERLCEILVCEPQDLIAYHPSKKYPLPSNHPLNSLIKNDDPAKSIKNTLRYLPYKDLMDITKKIADSNTPKKEKPDNPAEPSL